MNFDPSLHEVVAEAYYLSRPPLNMRMPPVIKSLLKGMNKEELRDRRVSLELVMQAYRDIQTGMNEEERLLLHSKLQQVETVRRTSLHTVGWMFSIKEPFSLHTVCLLSTLYNMVYSVYVYFSPYHSCCQMVSSTWTGLVFSSQTSWPSARLPSVSTSAPHSPLSMPSPPPSTRSPHRGQRSRGWIYLLTRERTLLRDYVPNTGEYN